MALQIEKPTKYGVGASYWRFASLNHFGKKINSITVHGFTSGSAEQEVDLFTCQVTDPDFFSVENLNLADTNHISRAYEYLKLHPFFEGAIDV